MAVGPEEATGSAGRSSLGSDTIVVLTGFRSTVVDGAMVVVVLRGAVDVTSSMTVGAERPDKTRMLSHKEYGFFQGSATANRLNLSTLTQCTALNIKHGSL